MYLMPLRAIRSGLKCGFIDFKYISCRNLFTREELGVVQFERLRQTTLGYFKNPQDEERKAQFVGNFKNMRLDEKGDNLKHFILLLDGKGDELENLKKMLLNYYDSFNNSEHSVGDFCFATQIMRMFYILNMPDEAIDFFRDLRLKNEFQHTQTYKVLLSLLFENKRYADVFDLYNEIRKRLDLFEMLPDVTINCLLFGACYHLNTVEHFDYAKTLWKLLQNIKQINRSKFFLAGFALKQNNPEFALNLVEGPNTYVTIRFIKVIAYTQMGKYDDACDILHQSIEHFKLQFTKNKLCFGKEMLTNSHDAIKQYGTDEQLKRFNKIQKDLKTSDLISREVSSKFCFQFHFIPFLTFKRMFTFFGSSVI